MRVTTLQKTISSRDAYVTGLSKTVRVLRDCLVFENDSIKGSQIIGEKIEEGSL